MNSDLLFLWLQECDESTIFCLSTFLLFGCWMNKATKREREKKTKNELLACVESVFWGKRVEKNNKTLGSNVVTKVFFCLFSQSCGNTRKNKCIHAFTYKLHTIALHFVFVWVLMSFVLRIRKILYVLLLRYKKQAANNRPYMHSLQMNKHFRSDKMRNSECDRVCLYYIYFLHKLHVNFRSCPY